MSSGENGVSYVSINDQPTMGSHDDISKNCVSDRNGGRLAFWNNNIW
jgi:hypothetical protein